ncbi:MAG TPA: S8 family serine peptidase, partial [Actinomycetota bacterium]
MQTVSGLSPEEQLAVILRNGGVETSSIAALRLHVVAVPVGDVDQALQNYGSDPQVESVDRDRTRDAEGVPSDPSYPDQWALPKIAWDQAYGSITPSGSATIAVLDTGVDSSVADLSGRLVPGHSAFPGADPSVDPNGHGTWLASIAAAATDNAEGIAGVSYADAWIMPVQVLDAAGTGQDSEIIGGVVWAADHGADVILMGFSNPGFSNALQDAVEYAWSKGVVLVAATGNDGSSSPTYPAGDAKVVGVSATDSSDALWSGSNYGADAFLGAPGVGISADAPGSGTTSVTGTSAAAAIVAGAAALLKANDSSASPAVIAGRLARNADPAGTPDQTGNGRLNLARSLNDTATDPVVPAGAPGGGPLVGPYQIAAEKSAVSGWRKSSDNWSSVNSSQVYSEGSTVPIKVQVTGLTPGTSYTITLRYDFRKTGAQPPNTVHFIDWLNSVNPDGIPNVDPCQGISPCASPTPVNIPTDPEVSAFQTSGSLTAYNVTGTPTFGTYSTVVSGADLKKQIDLTFTANNATVVLAFGGHLARDNEWGAGKGASQYSGGSGKAYSQLTIESSENNVGINPNLNGGTVSGTKYLDRNGDGVRDADGVDNIAGNADDEVPLSGWTIRAYVDSNGNGNLEPGETTVASQGTAITSSAGFNLISLIPGTYVICERINDQPTWFQSQPSNTKCSAIAVGQGVANGGYAVTVAAQSDSAGNDFGNFQQGVISGIKYLDRNGDGVRDADGVDNIAGNADDEVPLSGWTIRAYVDSNGDGMLQAGETTIAASATTAPPTGAYSLTVNPGKYVICERVDDQAGFSQTQPSNSNCAALPGGQGVAGGGYAATVTSGSSTLNQIFGNTQGADLSISKSDSPDPVTTGTPLTYTIDVSNGGPLAATSVTVTDALPAGTTYVSASGSGWTCSHLSGTVTCTRPSAPVGAAPTITIVVTAPGSPGTISNTASVSSAVFDPNTANNSDTESTEVVGQPVLEVTKTADSSSVDAGDEIGFVITVKNAGNANALSVTLTDTLPANSGLSWSIDAGGSDSGCSIGSGTLTCDFGTLAPNASKHVHITSPTTSATCGTVSNTAAASASNAGTAQSSASVIVNCPAIQVVKSVDKPVINAGETVTYTYTVTNAGDTPLSGVSASDDKCSPVTFIGGDANSNGKLDVGETWTYTCSTSLIADTTNTATATATSSHGHTVSDMDTAFVDVRPSITVTKSASPTSLPEPGGPVQFTVKVKNNSLEAVTLNTLTDDVYGDLDKDSAPGDHSWTSSDCDTGGSIAAGATYECHFTAPVTGEPGDHTDTATAKATDDDGSSDTQSGSATVKLTDVAPTITVTKSAIPSSLPEPGGAVQFTVKVKNTSFEAVILNTLTDNVYGDLDKDSPPASHSWTSSDCDTGGSIAAGATYECHFIAQVTGQPSQHSDTATAKATDNDGSSDTESGSAMVEITNASPTIAVTKTASPTTVSEPGGAVSFTIEVKNTSVATDPVTLTSLTDSIHGDLNGQGSCATGGTIAPGTTYSCSFTATVSGNAGESETDVVTANVKDDENTAASGQDDATVTVTNVDPSITVTKTASPTSVDEPGGSVTFTVEVKNTSVATDPVTLTSLTDSIHGNLNGQGTCSTSGTINPGTTYSCSFTATVSGNANDSETDTATANVKDDEGSTASGQDDATVTVADVAPTIMVTKDASPTSVTEPGGTVTFTVTVKNTSVNSDPVTLDSLTDDAFGDLDKDSLPASHTWTSSTCDTGGTINPGGTYSCSFTGEVSGNAGSIHTDEVTAEVTDDDGSTAQGADDATV